MRSRSPLLFVLAWLVAGCAATPGAGSAEDAFAGVGPPPARADIVQAVQRDMRGTSFLGDVAPERITIEHDTPQQTQAGGRISGAQPGWLVHATIRSGGEEVKRNYVLRRRPHGFGTMAIEVVSMNLWIVYPTDKVDRELAAVAPDPIELLAADAGPRPDPADAALRAAIGEWTRTDATTLQLGEPQRTWGRAIGRSGTVFGWRLGDGTAASPTLMVRDGKVLSSTLLGTGFELTADALPR